MKKVSEAKQAYENELERLKTDLTEVGALVVLSSSSSEGTDGADAKALAVELANVMYQKQRSNRVRILALWFLLCGMREIGQDAVEKMRAVRDAGPGKVQ